MADKEWKEREVEGKSREGGCDPSFRKRSAVSRDHM